MAKGALTPLDRTPDEIVDKALLAARADEIEEVELRSVLPDGPRLDLARRGTGWHERAPEDRDLNPEEVDAANTLVTAMAGAQASSVQSAAEGPRVLARTRATFVRTGSGSTETLEISAPDGSGLVLARRSDDGAVLRLPPSVARRFEPHRIALRGRTPWATTFDPAEVIAVEDTCTPEPERIELVGGLWEMRSPHDLPADGAYTMDLVEALAHAKTDGWISERDDGSFGLGAQACRVTLSLAGRDPDGGAASRAMVFGGDADGSLYGRTLDDPGVFLAPAALRAIAQHPAIDRSRFRIEAVPGARATLSHDPTRIVLWAAGGGFSRAGLGDAGNDKLGAALAQFYALDALHAGPPVPGEGFDHPTLEIHVSTPGDGASERHFVIGASAEDGPAHVYFSRVSGIDATFAVEARTVDALLEHPPPVSR